MDLILFTITKLKQFVEKLKSLFGFLKSNYLPDVESDGWNSLFPF